MPTYVESADTAKERRLDEIRREAEDKGRVEAPGVRAVGAPFPVGPAMPDASPESGYYGLPLLKQPAWIWTVPVYLFVGGAAGGSAVIAAVSEWSDEDRTLPTDARWIALAGAALSPALLVADLGRPARFLNMLRVFKPQSPMSVGVWTLIGFSAAAGSAVAADLGRRTLQPTGVLKVLADGEVALSDATAGVIGLVLATYTGVLFGVTTVPVWARNVRLLPFHFGTSGMASAVGLLELLGHHGDGMWRLALATSIGETAVGAMIEMDQQAALDPLRRGKSGLMTRIGGVLSGPVPLALRLLGRRSRAVRYAAAACSIAGSLVTRFAWLEAGRASARDPRIPLDLAPSREREELTSAPQERARPAA